MTKVSIQDAPLVMVVDDDDEMRAFLSTFLEARGYRADARCNADEAVKQYQSSRPAAVILDLMMPGDMDGLGALAAFKKIDSKVPIIVVSGQGRTSAIVQAMKLGAADFVSKPFDATDLDTPLANALEQHRLTSELAAVRTQLESQSSQTMLFGQSPRMAEIRELIERVADTDITILIRGESGTGKELVAAALRDSSLRRHKPFVKVNCAALPAELLESELFGFERGAFTGATHDKPGKFEFANHGTMFLDEIGDMSFPLQAKLLQVLQDGEFSRLGGKHDVRVDVRVIAATNRNLEQAVADGQFREDLFFRLNVVAVDLPPLRERREDVPLLADYFLKTCSVQYKKPLLTLSPATMQLLVDYDWPGNIRELENLIKRSVVLSSEAAIQKDVAHGAAMAAYRAAPPVTKLPALSTTVVSTPTESRQVPAAPPAPIPVEAATVEGDARTRSLKDISRTAAREAERELIARTLQHTRWNRKETAAILGISYKALLYKIKDSGLDKAS